ncbi:MULTISPECIES: PDGLE domain-containing protein [Saccharothrix]|uniref:Cobalt/nickel transport protein n=1 Tax=Saccharothrix texasensis TaxID=103734 RepID=A0A3N1HFX5_9PSEU|nr:MULTISPECIES: PDGLE domain-containing protein [Saccharothrix]ROP41408.1 cobalt/nickel transport protein [Saccharothrix texasensis]
MKRFFLGFAVVSVLLAGVVSYFADSDPDGLDHVTEQQGIAEHAREHPLSGWPLADYALGGDDRFTGLAGVLGVAVTLAVAGGLFRVLRKRPGKPADAKPDVG